MGLGAVWGAVESNGFPAVGMVRPPFQGWASGRWFTQGVALGWIGLPRWGGRLDRPFRADRRGGWFYPGPCPGLDWIAPLGRENGPPFQG